MQMDYVEFAEGVSGRKLTTWEKEILARFEKFPRGAVVIMTRRGPVIVDPKKGEKCQNSN